MLIELDYREDRLMKSCESLKEKYPEIEVKFANLHLGDIAINDSEKILIERKTLADLEASIKDGRYTEQSFRLSQAKEEGWTIYYFLEGDLSRYSGGIKTETIISTIYSLTHKGFFVIQTKNIDDTALYLLQFSDKIRRDESGKPKTNTYESSSVNKKKNSNITRDNISLYMLSQIPNISVNVATILLEKYKHINVLIEELNKDPTILDGFTYIKDGKTRKMNKNVIENVKEFLLKDIQNDN